MRASSSSASATPGWRIRADPQLGRLGIGEREAEALRQALREGAAAEREHLRAADAPAAHERDVGRPAADVDEDRAAVAELARIQARGHGIRLGDHAEQVERQRVGDRLERPEVDHRREGVEQVQLDLGAGEADGVADRIAVDLHLDDRRVDEAHVEPIHPGLPADPLLGLAQRRLLGAGHEPLELGLAERRARVVATHGGRAGGSLHELAGDADDRRRRPPSRHGPRLVHGGAAVRDHRVDVADRPRLHVRQPLALAPGATNDADQPALGIVLDGDDQCLGELGADVERGDRRGAPRPLGAANQVRDAPPELLHGRHDGPVRPSRSA